MGCIERGVSSRSTVHTEARGSGHEMRCTEFSGFAIRFTPQGERVPRWPDRSMVVPIGQ